MAAEVIEPPRPAFAEEAAEEEEEDRAHGGAPPDARS